MSPTAFSAGAKNAIIRIICIQMTITLVGAALSMIIVDHGAAYSSVIGGAISIIATICFAVHVFSAGIGAPPATIARAFYVGEAVKISLSILLFASAILWLEVSFLPLVLTYAATLACYWLVLPFSIDSLGRTR